jgi:tRNA(Ile)-lysidine synthase
MLPVKRFTDFVEQHDLFSPADTILTAVSGGIDSVVMAQLFKAAGYQFAIAHCNFKLRDTEADHDQQFVMNLAAQLGVEFHTTAFDTAAYANDNKISIQMAARTLRYNWFAQLAQKFGYKAISLAHHQNDTIETILLNLTRGTGIAGLHGILPKNGNLVRPLLFLSRVEIETIAEQEGLTWAEDSSNSSVKYARNKIRHQVVPLLKELNPSLEATFENNLKNFREMEVLLDNTVAGLQQKLLIKHGDEVHIDIAEADRLSPKRLLLLKLLQPYGFSDTVVSDVIDGLHKHAGRAYHGSGFRLIIDRGKLIISPNSEEGITPATINADNREVNFGAYKLTLLHDDSALIVKDNPMAVSVDADKLSYPLTVRQWQQGDQFYPLGMKTRQKLSDFFVHQKVPVHKKSRVPVIINNNGDVIWIGGYRLDERYKVTYNTKKVTIFELYNYER